MHGQPHIRIPNLLSRM